MRKVFLKKAVLPDKGRLYLIKAGFA